MDYGILSVFSENDVESVERVVQEWCNIYNINTYNIIHTMMLQLKAVYTIIQRVLQYEDGVCLFLSVYMVLQLYIVQCECR